MIITGGENVYSIEVERALAAHPEVTAVAVVGAPDGRWGEVVTAFVVLAAGSTLTSEDLKAHCRSLIARYKVPKSRPHRAVPAADAERQDPESGTKAALAGGQRPNVSMIASVFSATRLGLSVKLGEYSAAWS